MIHVFFFSSRRRHTRSLCDWSSDVCSSDLDCGEAGLHERGWRGQGPARRVDQGKRSSVIFHARLLRIRYVMLSWDETECGEIGRASCRERCKSWGWPEAEKKKRVKYGGMWN